MVFLAVILFLSSSSLATGESIHSQAARDLKGDQHDNHGRNHNRSRSSTVRTSSQQSLQHMSSNQRQYPKRYYTQLSDVFLCLAMALGWTVWMLSSLVRSELWRYQKDSVLVRGNVLEVSVEEDSLGTGIPTYRAVIDYVVDGGAQETIQVRKHFETQNLLTQGFSNVEILVLPEEPTYSVLREDFQQQVEEHKEDEMEAFIRHPWCKRLSMTFAGILVLVSLGGCVQVVVRLDPLTRWQGWTVLCVGVALLLPTCASCCPSDSASHGISDTEGWNHPTWCH